MMEDEQKRLYAIFEAMEDGIYVSKDDYTVQFMNNSMVQDFGQGVGKLCYQLINGRDEICPWCKSKSVFEGETVHWEKHIRGTGKTYDVIDLPLKNSDGTISKLSICRDITQRKRSEKRLKASEEDYKRLFQHVGCGVYVSSKEGKFLDANQALLDMLGYKNLEEFLGIDITRDLYLRPEDRQKFQNMIERDGKVIDYEVDFKLKNGEPIPVLLTSHVRYDLQGKVLGYEGIIVDQSQRKRMEQDLRKAEEFLKNIINSSLNPIVVADMKGVVLLMNESARKLGGYGGELPVGEVLAEDFYPPGVAKGIMKKLRSPDFGGIGKLEPIEMMIMTSPGEEIPMEMTASIIYQDGKEVATMAIFQDLRPKIEAEKRLEKARVQLIQSEKLASIGRLAAGVAHEINNPLGGIVMYSHLALEDLSDDTSAYGNLQKVVIQAERCKKIVKGLLDFSRQHEPKIEAVDANEIIEGVFSLLESQALFHNIEIIKALDANLPPIMGDKSQLQQVFINLTLNAAEAMGDGGELNVGSSHRGDFVEIRFADNGCGIPPENVEKIFEPFFTTKSAKSGTGLGLSLSHGIITTHKGTITVESKINEGTTFTIRLPISKK